MRGAIGGAERSGRLRADTLTYPTRYPTRYPRQRATVRTAQHTEDGGEEGRRRRRVEMLGDCRDGASCRIGRGSMDSTLFQAFAARAPCSPRRAQAPPSALRPCRRRRACACLCLCLCLSCRPRLVDSSSSLTESRCQSHSHHHHHPRCTPRPGPRRAHARTLARAARCSLLPVAAREAPVRLHAPASHRARVPRLPPLLQSPVARRP